MFNRPTHQLLFALVCLALAMVACNALSNNSRTVSPQVPQSTSCPGVPNPPDPNSSSFSDRLHAVRGEVLQAKTLTQQLQFAGAILCWDDVLIRVPEYADGYYQRSQNYRYLTANQRVQTEYLDYLHHALADLNQAISLSPETGDYYFARFQIENTFADNEIYLVDKNIWYMQAYQDITLANELGTKGELADREPGFLLVNMERCNEAVDEFNRLTSINTHGPSAGLNTGLSYSAQCLGNYEEALKYIDHAITLHTSFQREYAHATILYNMGRLDEALSNVNKLIANQRYYCGCRYYLRALIYYDLGQKDLAQADIDFGTGQTWGRGGIRSYVLGHLALDAGDQEQGISLLQEAEASLTWQFGSLRKRVQEELETLGSEPLTLSVSVPATPTLLPITPQVQPPTPTSIVLDKPVNFAGLPMAYSGNSSFNFIPDMPMMFHFAPPQPLNFVTVESLVLTISGDIEVQNRIVKIDIWRPAYNDWQNYFSEKLGSVPISEGADYVTSTGDIYAYITIKGDQMTPIEVLGVTLTVRNSDGGTSQYGLPLSP